ncbi:MAG: hypothetical protein Faunusvirus23_6 [Faunusvirus sp.]|jgi:ankyrin repeat protein|uniref:Ankyrin repeat protein n=1 Tax=Faunusvirus sp. TaxID=2487766 RepID=A0A3G5A259_9VIRU|nr:MAG: hypothetical protein Faunusvirus23_6 [Faunusvirus sp.]
MNVFNCRRKYRTVAEFTAANKYADYMWIAKIAIICWTIFRFTWYIFTQYSRHWFVIIDLIAVAMIAYTLTQDKDALSRFRVACDTGNCANVGKFLRTFDVNFDFGSTYDSVMGTYRITPLAIACMNNNCALVKLLFAHNANANVFGSNGKHIILAMCSKYFPDMVKLLAYYPHTDLTTCSFEVMGFMARQDPADNPVVEIVRQLCSNPTFQPAQPFLYCIELLYTHIVKPKNVPEITKIFMTRKFDINTINENGDTLLTLALEYKLGDLVVMLLQQPEINVSIKNKYGDCALDYAHRFRHDKQIINPLKDHMYGCYREALNDIQCAFGKVYSSPIGDRNTLSIIEGFL